MQVPCPTCAGTGSLDADLCQATLSTGQPCQAMARSFTEPRYLEWHGLPNADDYPTNFMQLCSRHGNAAHRRIVWHRHLERTRLGKIRPMTTLDGRS